MFTGFRQPTDVHVGPEGEIYVPELQGRVTIIDGEGEILARWGGDRTHEAGKFWAPHGVAVDSRGDMYIGEVLEGMRLQKFIPRPLNGGARRETGTRSIFGRVPQSERASG